MLSRPAAKPTAWINSCTPSTSGLIPFRQPLIGLLLLVIGGLEHPLAAEAADEQNLLGRYEAALPRKRDDRGDITRHPTEPLKFRWTNDSGSSWDLTPNIASGLLEADEEAPDIQLQFEGRPGESAVRTIRIKGRLYFRKTVPGKKPPSPPPAEVTSVSAAAGKVTKIDDLTYEVGNITVHKQSRIIAFNALVNQVSGPIEYLLVNARGKTHESLFLSNIRPINLNVAFLLIGYQPSPELFQIRTPDHRPTGKYPTVPEKVRSLARLRIAATWRSAGEEVTVDVNDLIMNNETGAAMAPGPWLYTGSVITETGFRAEQTGDIAAVFSDPSAMVNHPSEARTRDDIWSVRRGPLPAVGSPIRITITPFFDRNKPLAKQNL